MKQCGCQEKLCIHDVQFQNYKGLTICPPEENKKEKEKNINSILNDMISNRKEEIEVIEKFKKIFNK